MDKTEEFAPEKAASVSSVEEAVNELLSMTTAAVKKLTESKPTQANVSDDSVDQDLPSLEQPQQPMQDSLSAYHADKRLLKLLSETQHSTPENVHENPEDEGVPEKITNDGKVIDITTVLQQDARSEVSILDVGGGQPDTFSSASTPSIATSQATPVSSSSVGSRTLDRQNLQSDPVGGLPGDSILSPISFPPGFENPNKEDDIHHDGSFSAGRAKGTSKNLTSSVKSSEVAGSISPQDLSGNSSTASEVLKQSTRAPKLPDSVRTVKIKVPESSTETKATEPGKLSPVVMKDSGPSSSQKQTTKIVIRKSNHVEKPTDPKPIDTTKLDSSGPDKDSSQYRVRISKRRLREVKSPVDGGDPTEHKHLRKPQPYQLDTRDQPASKTVKALAQGVKIDEKENQGLKDTDLNIIKSDKGMAMKKMLGMKGLRTNPMKRIVTANVVERKDQLSKGDQNGIVSTATAVAAAVASATPMLQVKQDLESQVRRLTEKLDELEKQKQLEVAAKHHERAADLENKLEQLTLQRLRSLEQLQEQQAAWQSHFLKVIGNIQKSQDDLSSAAQDKAVAAQYPLKRGVRFNSETSGANFLQTPAPRTQAPIPIKKQGMSPGNGHLLQNILDQWDISTPGPSPAVPPRTTALRDPLADLTPVRGPMDVPEKLAKDPGGLGNLTSTPQNLEDTRAAILRARKEAEKEAERLEIMKRFPASLSQYMMETICAPVSAGGPPPPPAKLLPSPPGPKKPASVEGLWKVLEDLQTTRKYLDDNLAAVERGRGGENIAAKVDFEILSKHPDANPEAIEKLRIRKMVDEQINSLQEQIKEGRYQPKTFGRKGGLQDDTKGGRGRLPKARAGARVDTGLRRQAPYGARAKGLDLATKGVRGKQRAPTGHRGPKTRSASPQKSVLDDTTCGDNEDIVTHIYGRADYHPRRSTVHDPYIHIKSPLKQPIFRKKQAVEVVKANLIKSAKTQTSPTQSKHSQYYFTPSSSPVRPPISVSPTPGQLIPMAIPLGAPRVSDAGDPAPLLIHQGDPPYVTVTTGSPGKNIRIYDPTTHDTTRKPNTAVINIRGDDGPDLSVQKLDNIDIDTPEVSEAVPPQIMLSGVHDQEYLPGSSIVHRPERDDSEETEGSLRIELCGGGSEERHDYHGPSFPPVPPQPKPLAGDIAGVIDQHEIENEAVRWVEQEIMARILSELHPPGAQCKDSGPVHDQQSDEEEEGREQDSVLLNPESLQLFIDAGLPIDGAIMNKLVEEELIAILRDMIKQTGQQQQETRPKEPVPPPAPVEPQIKPHFYQVPTPLPTPEPSPASSISEKPKPHLHTPSVTPESSMAESLEAPTPEQPSPKARTPTPEVLSPPKTPEEVTLVQTPQATPPRTPTPEPQVPGTPTLSESSKSVPPPRTPPPKFPDPWGGAEFPLPEELHMRGKPSSAMTFAPPPDAVDLVVREVTPPPATPPDRSEISESETTTSTSDGQGESSISEGQLVICHGEVRLKSKAGKLPGIIEELFDDADVERSMGFQSTLRDANELQNEDYDPYSDGEIRLNMRPSMIARVSDPSRRSRKPPSVRFPDGDDPVGIYARPRHPLPSEDEVSDMSVGEVKPKTIMDRKNKFKRWREERSPRYSQGKGTKGKKGEEKKTPHTENLPDSPLSMGDLNKNGRSPATSEAESYETDQSQEISGGEYMPQASLGPNVIVVTPSSTLQKPLSVEKDKELNFHDKKPSDAVRLQVGTSGDLENTGASTDQSVLIKDSLDESMRKKNGFEKDFYDDQKGQPAQPLKVSLTLPSAGASMSSEPVTEVDDVSEISTGGF